LVFPQLGVFREKCDLDLSVEWAQVLFRSIKLTALGVAQTS